MIDGMKIILERMKTHPEEFVGEFGISSRWENLVHHYHSVLTDEEKKAFNDGIHELRRQSFTSRVLEVLMEEPTQLDPDTYTIKTAGRFSPSVTAHPYATKATTLSIQEEILKEKEKEMEQAMQREYARLAHDLAKQQAENQTKQEKNKSKMEKLLKRMTGSNY